MTDTITLPRAETTAHIDRDTAIALAREAGFREWHPQINEMFALPSAIERLCNLAVERAKVAQQAEQVPCEWSFSDDDSGTWASSCGELWSFIDGGPKENRVSYCHHCGKPVKLAAAPKGAQQAEQAGWVRVPVEPTPEMLGAIWAYKQDSLQDCYRALLAAAPKGGVA